MSNPLISFVCLPPADIHYPLSGQTVLKSFIQANGYDCKIKYLNISVEKIFETPSRKETIVSLLPYLYLYNSFIVKDEQKKASVKRLYLKNYESIDFDNEMLKYYLFLINSIDEILAENPVLIGFSSKFSQWIPASICAHIIKKKSPQTPVMIGGWSVKEATEAILKIHPFFDYAMWGESELPLLQLCNYLTEKSEMDIKEIPRIAVRESEKAHVHSQGGRDSYLSFNRMPLWDYSDYIQQYDIDEVKILSTERSRGCSWNGCRFCYLSQGYLYREKSNILLIEEIRRYIVKYQVYKFRILDNNFVGKSIPVFKDFLIELGILKKQYPEFGIVMAEIITKDLDAEIIQRMKDAGIELVQIGLESISPTQLSRYNKFQSDADNLFFLREATRVGIIIADLNIIVNTPDDNIQWVNECVGHLHFFRFFYSIPNFFICLVELTVMKNSRYLRQIRKEGLENDYDYSKLVDLIGDNFSHKIDRFSLFEYAKRVYDANIWSAFLERQKYYIEHIHTYRILFEEDGFVIEEYMGGIMKKNIPVRLICDIHLFSALNKKVYGFNELLARINQSIICEPETLKQRITIYHDMGYIYYTSGFKEITSIIYIDQHS